MLPLNAPHPKKKYSIVTMKRILADSLEEGNLESETVHGNAIIHIQISKSTM
jgi:hypothetical protein